ncbi:SNF5-domain-containing protein, partial [Calocera viscosa TUFC12733]
MLREVEGRGEVLVPIRLEVEHEHWRLRDTFVWNVNADPIMTPDLFAQTICDDFHLPMKEFFPLVRESVLKQLQEAGTFDFSADAGAGAEVGEILRVLIKLDITYGMINLTDQFEWDINNSSVTPEQWAESYAADLGLAPEFKTAIAHDIREQVQVMRKSLIISGHTFEGPVLDAELRGAFLPPISPTALTRNADEAMQYTPILSQLTEAEIAREEAEREKEARRRKRQTRGR